MGKLQYSLTSLLLLVLAAGLFSFLFSPSAIEAWKNLFSARNDMTLIGLAVFCGFAFLAILTWRLKP